MKSTVLISTVSLLASLLLSAESISVNIASDRDAVDAVAEPAGALSVLGTNWNNASGPNGTLGSLLDDGGNTTTGSITWTAPNTYFSGGSGDAATNENQDLTKGYLDDGGAGWTVSMSSPYLLSDIYIYNATDQGGGTENADVTMGAIQVNGSFYRGNGTTTVSATGYNDTWTAKNWTNDDTLGESQHYLKVSNLAAIELAGVRPSGGRSAIGGLEVENAYSGTLSYWDLDGATPGAGGGTTPTGNWAEANWSASAEGTSATTSNWTSGNAAVFSAGSTATGSYTVTLGGTENADAVWVQDGDVTLTGGTLALGSTGLLRSDGSLTVDSAVTASNLTTTGAVTLNSSSNSISGLATINGATTLGANNTWGQVTGGGTLDLGGNTLSVGDATNSNAPSIVGSTGSGLVKTGSGTLTAGNVLDTLDAITISGGTLSLTGGGNTSWSLGGGGTLRKTGGGTLSIGSTANTFTGKTEATGGILRIADQTSLGSTPAAPTADHITLSGGAKIQGGTADAGANITLDANRGIVIAGGTSGFHTWTGFTTTVNGDITGGGSLASHDGGNLVINGNVNITGGLHTNGGQASTTTYNSATLVAGGGFDLRAGTTNLNVGTATLEDIELGNAGSQSHTFNHQGGDVTVDKDIRIGHWSGATSTYTMQGGTLTQPDTVTSVTNEGQANFFLGIDGSGVLNLENGTINTTSLVVDGRNYNSGTGFLAVTGGTLNVGKWGIRTNYGNYTVQLGGGTLGTTSSDATHNWSASWSSNLNMELTGTNGNITFDTGANDITLTGALSGTGGFVKEGSGALVIGNAGNSYTGTSIINDGTLYLGGTASQVTLKNGAHLQAGNAATAGTGTTDTLTLEDGSTSAFRVGGTADQINVTGTDGFTVVSGATHNATITPTGQLFVNDEFVLFDYAGTVQGEGATGISASLPNPHYGFSINDDTVNTQVKLKIDSIDSVIWTGAGGSTWDVESTTSWKLSSDSSATDFYEFDSVKFDSSSPAGSVTLSGTITPASVEFDSSNTHTLTGAGIGGSGGLTKKGSGIVVLANSNSYTGTTDVQAGILQVGDGGTTGAITGSGSVSVAAGAQLVFNRSDAQTHSIATVGGGTLVKNSGNNLTITAGNNAVDMTINNGSLLARGGGWGTSFAGNRTITVNAGGTLDTVTHSMGGLGGAVLPNVHLNGGTWQLNNEQYMSNLTMTGGLTTGPGEVRTTGGGVYTINATAGGSEMAARLNMVGGKTFEVADGAAAADLLISGPIVGGASLTKTGAGRMVWSGTNTSSGNAVVSEGRLALTGDNSGRTGGYEVTGGILEVSSVGDASVGTGFIALKNGTLEYNGAGAESTTRTLWIDAGGQSGTFDITNAAASLTLTPGGGSVNQEVIKTGAGTLTMQGAISGGGAVTVNAGTMILDAANTYTGDTTVNGGTLELAAGASIGNSANIIVGASTTFDVSAVTGFTVGAAQTLSGTGTVSGNTIADGTVAPGASPGTLSFDSDLNLTSTSLLDIEIAGNLVNQYDRLDVTGDFTADGTIAVTLAGYNPVLGDAFDLVDAGSFSGTPTFDFANAVLDPGLSWGTSSFLIDGSITVVPEPSAICLVLAAGGLLARRRRR